MATKSSKPVITMLNKNGRVPKIMPRDKTKPATTLSRTWPATMLAKRRTESVIGLIRKEKSSMAKIAGAIHIGTPLGRNMCKKPKNPLRIIAKIVTVKNATMAKQSVIITWLVAVKL